MVVNTNLKTQAILKHKKTQGSCFILLLEDEGGRDKKVRKFKKKIEEYVALYPYSIGEIRKKTTFLSNNCCQRCLVSL